MSSPKWCPCCNVTRTCDDFARCVAREDGLQSQCRKCVAAIRRGRRAERKPFYWRDVLLALGLRHCTDCDTSKPLDAFFPQAGKFGGVHSHCRECRNARGRARTANDGDSVRAWRKEWRRKNPDRCREYARRHHLKVNYGLSEADYDALVERHGGCCAICGGDAGLAVDHCHTTGVVRGLLCTRCNPGLGFFQDDPELLRQAIDYLERSRLTAVA